MGRQLACSALSSQRPGRPLWIVPYIALVFLGGVQLVLIGVLGEYVVYLRRGKVPPAFFKERLGGPPSRFPALFGKVVDRLLTALSASPSPAKATVAGRRFLLMRRWSKAVSSQLHKERGGLYPPCPHVASTA